MDEPERPAIDELVDLIRDTWPDGADGAEPVEPVFAVDLDEFRLGADDDPLPLLGTKGDTIIPAGGLVIVAGQPGVGKTTLLLDLVYHLASGRDWLQPASPDETPAGCPLVIARPLNVLLIENEGPQHMFRAKVQQKTEAWHHERLGQIWIQTWRWGLFSFADFDARGRLIDFVERHPVDVIVGDPLGSLGPGGVGSPDDTRRFVLSLLELQLPVAYAFVAHFRKEPTSNEVDQLSGAWAGHLDALLLLKPTRRRDEVRLSFPKTRWTESQRKPLILGYVRATQSFEVLGEEGDAKLLWPALVEALKSADVPQTPTELAKLVQARRTSVEACLKGNSHLFESLPGSEVNRRAKLVWRLVPEGGTGLEPHSQATDAQPVPTANTGQAAGQADGAQTWISDAPDPQKGDGLNLSLSPPLSIEGEGGTSSQPRTTTTPDDDLF